MLDSLVDVDYDSALSVLVQLDTRGMEKGEQMYALLLKGKAMNKADSLFTTDSVMLEVCNYFDRHGNSNQRMLAHYVLGCAYRDMRDAPRALQCYQDAVEQADTTRSDCDLSTLMRVHSQMCKLYGYQQITEYELEEARIAEKLSWKQGDTLSALLLQQTRCYGLYRNGQYRECIEAAEMLQRNCIKYHRYDLADIVNVSFVKSYLRLQDFDKAKIYLDRYESAMAIKEKQIGIVGGWGYLYMYKAEYFKGVSNPDSAEYYYKKALSSQGPGFRPITTYKGLYDIYATTGQVDSMTQYMNLYMAEKEKQYDAEQMSTMMQMQSLYGYNAESQKAEKELKKVFAIRMRGYGMASAVLLLFALFCLYAWNQRLKKERKINAVMLDYWQASEQLSLARKQVEDLSSQKEHSEMEIKSMLNRLKDAEQREKELNTQVQQIASCKRRHDLSNTDIVKAFHGFAEDRSDLKPEHWLKLRELVENTYPSFYEELNGGTAPLTDYEYHMCLLMKCDFFPKDIDKILGTQNYTSTTQRRLLKKVYGIDGNARVFSNRVKAI